MKIGNKEIPRRKLFIAFTKWNYLRARGNYWISFLQAFIDWRSLVLYGGILSLKFPKVPLWIWITALIVGGVISEFVKWIIGWFDFKKGIWQIESEWAQKTRQLSPFNLEVKETLIEICRKLDIPNHFNDIK